MIALNSLVNQYQHGYAEHLESILERDDPLWEVAFLMRVSY